LIADRLAGKDLAEVNLFAAHTDAAAPGHDNDLVVKGLVDIGQSLLGGGERMDIPQPGTSCPELREEVGY
jgi:hypothetical protein